MVILTGEDTTYFVGYKEIKLELTKKAPSCWLAFKVLEGVMQAPGGEKPLLVASHECCGPDLPGKICPLLHKWHRGYAVNRPLLD